MALRPRLLVALPVLSLAAVGCGTATSGQPPPRPAVFWRLYAAGPDGSIPIAGPGRNRPKLVVNHDVASAFSTPPAWLSLITREGTYTTGGYDHRLLVHSVLAGAA